VTSYPALITHTAKLVEAPAYYKAEKRRKSEAVLSLSFPENFDVFQ